VLRGRAHHLVIGRYVLLGQLGRGGVSAVYQAVDNHLVFTVGGRLLASKMIEGQFPAFEKVIALTGDPKFACLSGIVGLIALGVFSIWYIVLLVWFKNSFS